MKISKYNHRPQFFNTEASYRPSPEVWAKVYLDIAKDKVNDFSFQQEGLDDLVPQFSSLGESILGKQIFDVCEITTGDEFLSLPVKLLHQAIDIFNGRNYRHVLLKEDMGSLICRCFGVYRGQIIDVLKVNPNAEVINILDETSASGGCSSCRFDIENIIKDFRGDIVIKIPRKERILGMTPVDLHLKIDEFIKEFDSKNVVKEIKSNLVFLSVSKGQKELEEKLYKHFAGELLFSFQS